MSVKAIHVKMVEPAQMVWTLIHVTVLQDMKEHIVKQVSHSKVYFVKGKFRFAVSEIIARCI